MAQEIFTEVSEQAKARAEFIFNMALKQKNIIKMINLLNDYTNTCFNEEEKEFVKFYFNMRMEQINGSNFNQR